MTDDDGRIRALADGERRRPTGSSSTRRRRSSGASSSRSSSATAITTSRCSSRRTRARPTAAADASTSSRSCSRAARASSSGSRRSTTRSARAREVARDAHRRREEGGARRAPADRRADGGSRRARPPSRATTTTRRLAELAELNRAYEERFGFRFVVFVNRRPRREIVPILRERLERTREEELETALDELVAIAMDRWQQRPSDLRLLVGLGQPALPLAARDRRDRVDRLVVLLHRARQPPAAAGRRRDAERGVGGESWEIHGGGFYRIEKFRVAPETLPEPLHWFKWEAYTTWLSGFALLVVVYYVHARRSSSIPSVARPLAVGGDRDLDRRARARLARLRRALPRARRAARSCSRSCVFAFVAVSAWAARSCSRRARRTSRSAR